MEIIRARNVNDAYAHGLELLRKYGARTSSRAGEVLVTPFPVMTVYSHPWERVLFDVKRDANPFFHMMEALWMLAGRDDATWLDQFVKDFSARFGEEDGTQHGAYGHRWRDAFGFDQLNVVVERLRQHPNDRQCVIQMWDCSSDRVSVYEGDIPTTGQNDLLGNWKDRPCNTHIYLRVRGLSEIEKWKKLESMGVRRNPAERNLDGSDYHLMNAVDDLRVLDMTVCCRSNDIVWGAYGANAVHFSVLQEYLAARIGVGIGTYYQFSNNYHVYTNIFEKLDGNLIAHQPYENELIKASTLVTQPEDFDVELSQWMADPSHRGQNYQNEFFSKVASPMFDAYKFWREKRVVDARRMLATMPVCDWRLAAEQWLARRTEKRKQDVTVGS